MNNNCTWSCNMPEIDKDIIQYFFESFFERTSSNIKNNIWFWIKYFYKYLKQKNQKKWIIYMKNICLYMVFFEYVWNIEKIYDFIKNWIFSSRREKIDSFIANFFYYKILGFWFYKECNSIIFTCFIRYLEYICFSYLWRIIR